MQCRYIPATVAFGMSFTLWLRKTPIAVLGHGRKRGGWPASIQVRKWHIVLLFI